MAALASSGRTCLRLSLKNYVCRSLATEAYYQEPKKGDKVVVGVSGGVDSSVAALLLAKKDYDLSAVFMRNWDTRDESGSDKGCEWERDWDYAEKVCKKLDIPIKLVDLSKEYWTRVFEPSLVQWEAGVTPNPDVMCNREIKFGALLSHPSLPADKWFATGHYASKSHSTLLYPGSSPSLLPSLNPPRPQLRRPADRSKDQSYYLSTVTEEGLRRALFPLAGLMKNDVREIARKAGLASAEKEESMGLCFVGERGKFGNFLSNYIPPNPGPIIDFTTHRAIGRHQGLWTYTIGQGAGIPARRERMFVVKKDPAKNAVYVVHGRDHPALFTRTMYVSGFKWIWRDATSPFIDSPSGFSAHVMFRYRMTSVPCRVFRDPSSPESLQIELDTPSEGISPGQIAALYLENDTWCIGSGIIREAELDYIPPPPALGVVEEEELKKVIEPPRKRKEKKGEGERQGVREGKQEAGGFCGEKWRTVNQDRDMNPYHNRDGVQLRDRIRGGGGLANKLGSG